MNTLDDFRCRASAVGKLMTRQPSKTGFAKGTKDVVLAEVLRQGFGYQAKINANEIKKGNALEDEAIQAVGLLGAMNLSKNTERRGNKWFTGECDLLTADCTIDTKVSWSIDSFPWTDDDAIAMVKSSGYDWQGLIYNMLWGVKVHKVAFYLGATPEDCLGFNDDREKHIDLVNSIAIDKRVRIVTLKYDKDLIEKAKERVNAVQPYYQELYREIIG